MIRVGSIGDRIRRDRSPIDLPVVVPRPRPGRASRRSPGGSRASWPASRGRGRPRGRLRRPRGGPASPRRTGARRRRPDGPPRPATRAGARGRRRARRVEDRQVVGPGVELDREHQRRVGPVEDGQEVGHRQDPRADRPGLPAEPPGREGQDRVLDVGRQDPRGEPLDGDDRVVEPHRQVARVERHARAPRGRKRRGAPGSRRTSRRRASRWRSRRHDRVKRAPDVSGRRSRRPVCSAPAESVRNRSWRSPR